MARRGTALGARVEARIAVVVSRYNASVTDRLRDGAVAVIRRRLGPDAAEVVEAPGSYELPALALAAAQTGLFDGVVALGCLVHGQTRHDRYIADAVAHGLVQVTMRTGIPASFGVITAETAAQAAARAGGTKGNKGAEAAEALLDTIETIRSLRATGRGPIALARRLPDKVGRGRRSSQPTAGAHGGARVETVKRGRGG